MLRFLIFALIVVSGLIAYLGDQIGMKVGKKRLSIFGIRPKYTSMIITILTGILIAIISITLLMLASSGVRMAVFNMQELVEELNYLNRQVFEKDQRLKEMENEINYTQNLLDNIRKQKDQFQTELEQKQLEYEQLESRLKKAQEDYDTLSKTTMELRKSKVSLEQKLKNLEHQKNELEKQKMSLEAEVDSLQDYVKVLNERVNELTERTEELTREVVHYQLKSLHYQKQSLGYETKDIVYRKGELIYLDSLDTIPGATPAEIEKVINDYLDRANKLAQMRKVKIDEETGKSILLPGAELFEVAKALVDTSSEKILVGIYADKNILINDIIDAHIFWEENYRVYKKDEVIAQKVIDSKQDPSAIEREIVDLLNEVNKRSQERGLLPNPEGEVGKIGFVDFYTIVETIKQMHGKVKITIKATKDIWRDERLLSTDNLKFDVSPVGVEP
ncbi:hypothetical protein BBF96_11380 [Anoxybacter fermentans]|uniref:DUF3084 domain-containing protein n=1 Tax=Anoxybacter fermentans TaxID=1323375 RepID=A0A3S9T0B0_9FIRM|nr:DUF3084 domain-containing protein [Anoxybacter fermentans]AZR73940.1 hypothetical protein BBF96_11380 [Anoxybacter fermentans]